MSLASKLFATTNIEKLRAIADQRILRRALTAKDLVAIGLGTMIGGGIFTTIGPGIKLAGPAIIISYLLAGIASFFAALCYAELGAMVPIAGSAYTYAYATLGQLVAWIIGFSLLFEYGVSAAPVAQQFSGAIQSALQGFGVALPTWAQTSHLVVHGPWWNPMGWDLLHSQYDIVGAVFVILLSLLLSIGIRETATTNNVFVVLKIGALIVFVAFGITIFHPQNLHPFITQGWGKLTPFSGGNGVGIIPGAALVFFSYIGFDTATTTAEECKNPKRDVPMGVIGALLIGTVIYCAVAIVLVGDVPWKQVDQNAALQAAIAPLHNWFANWAITLGVIAGTTSVALSSLLGQTRIFYVMARDRMLPPFVAKIHPRFKTPMLMTMITGVGVALLTLIVPLTVLLDLVNIGTLMAFMVVCAGVIYLRRTRPDLPRSFRSPFVPWFPLLGILFSGFLAVFGLTSLTWIRFIISLAIGLIIYFAYGFRKSNPEEIEPVIEPEGLEFT
ncbi:MAG TPA: amino acid permease [Candidatus Baltobacteraceae bacterium]|jgi:APA family basic amino acid/polyamine antiporter